MFVFPLASGLDQNKDFFYIGIDLLCQAVLVLVSATINLTFNKHKFQH